MLGPCPWIQCKTASGIQTISNPAIQAELVGASSIVRPTRAISAEGHVSQTGFGCPCHLKREFRRT